MMKKRLFLLLPLLFIISCTAAKNLPKYYIPDSVEARMMSNKIRIARLEHNYDEKTFSTLLGISHKELLNIENAKYPPDSFLLHKISRYTGKPMEWFFSVDEKTEKRINN